MKNQLLLMMSFCLISNVAYSTSENLIPQSNTVDYSKMSAAELDTAFVSAVKGRRLEEIQQLIQAGANVNTPVPYTWTSGDCDWSIETTALMYAVRHNCPNMIKVLLKVKKQLNETLNKAFNEAIKEGYSDVVKALIEGGADINSCINDSQDTPLILAVEHARPEGEFSPQAQRRYESRWSQRREIIQTLLKAGANVKGVNRYGRTALMEAVIRHDLNTVLDLLKVPEINTGSFFGFGTAPINYADQDGNTALILALKHIRSSHRDNQEYNICKNSQSIIEALLKFPGIDPHHVNNKGETAIALLKNLS